MPGRGKAPATGKHSTRERWLLTYADLITLLLAFFVIMFAISSTDIVKYLNLRGALQQEFNIGVNKGERNESITDAGEISSAGAIPIVASPQLQAVQAQVDSLETQEGRFEQVVESVGQRPEGVYLRLAGSTTFVSGSPDLTPEGAAALTQVAEIIQNTTNASNDIRVEGHTDDIPPGSDRLPTNWELSTLRAVSVVRSLANAGISSDRLGAYGYSDTRPLQPNNSELNRRENRRVEIVILQPVIDVVGRIA